MGQGKNGHHLLEQLVQLDKHIEQQQRSQIPIRQVALLDFFEPSSQRLPPSPEQTTGDDYEDDESMSIQSKEEESNQMQQQHAVETILHSKLESNGQHKYLIRWMGNYKDSWQPKGNIRSDIIEDFDKKKMQEMQTSIWQRYKENLFVANFLFAFHVTSLTCSFSILFIGCQRQGGANYPVCK